MDLVKCGEWSNALRWWCDAKTDAVFVDRVEFRAKSMEMGYFSSSGDFKRLWAIAAVCLETKVAFYYCQFVADIVRGRQVEIKSRGADRSRRILL